MKILVVDDQRLFRQALIKLLKADFPQCEFTEAANGAEAIEALKKSDIDVILLDVQMPKINGIETLKLVKEIDPNCKVIMLTQFDEPSLVSQCLEFGANAFLVKNGDADEVKLTISNVLREGNYFSPFVIQVLRNRIARSSSFAKLELSPTEYRIISMLKEGSGTKDIAVELHLSSYTVDSYRKTLMNKTKVKNVAELIALAYRAGLVSTS